MLPEDPSLRDCEVSYYKNGEQEPECTRYQLKQHENQYQDKKEYMYMQRINEVFLIVHMLPDIE